MTGYLCKLIIIIITFVFISISIKAEIIIIKCRETTGTGGIDIFKIKNPEFFWYYNNKWYELAESTEGAAKDWEVIFSKNKIKLYNLKMKWFREIDLNTMTAYMKFPTGETYLYKCDNYKSN